MNANEKQCWIGSRALSESLVYNRHLHVLVARHSKATTEVKIQAVHSIPHSKLLALASRFNGLAFFRLVTVAALAALRSLGSSVLPWTTMTIKHRRISNIDPSR